jgi:hypothetical protein
VSRASRSARSAAARWSQAGERSSDASGSRRRGRRTRVDTRSVLAITPRSSDGTTATSP